MRDWSTYDHVGAIIEYEGGEADDIQTLQLFQNLVDTGLAWQLQGHYGRTATALIERGVVADSRNAEPAVAIADFLEQA